MPPPNPPPIPIPPGLLGDDPVSARFPDGNAMSGLSATGTGVYGTSASGIGVQGHGATGVLGESPGGRGVWGQSGSGIATVGDSTSGTGVWGHSITGVGVRGIGPTAAQFDGDVTINPLGDKNGSLTCYDITLTGGQDCTEYFDVSAADVIEPGTIVVLDDEGNVKACEDAYDRRVAGAISGAGPYKPGMVLGQTLSERNRLPISLVGKVFCKVDAAFEPIAVGDLLTTSATPGHAMKASDRQRAFGAVIGKAMGPLTEGRGLIPILIALQ